MEVYETDDIVVEGKHYNLVVGKPEVMAAEGFMRTFKIINKEFGVVEAEGPHEMQARYYHDYYEELKERFEIEGLDAIIGRVSGPSEMGA